MDIENKRFALDRVLPAVLRPLLWAQLKPGVFQINVFLCEIVILTCKNHMILDVIYIQLTYKITVNSHEFNMCEICDVRMRNQCKFYM